MNNLKPNTSGIDCVIKTLQENIFRDLGIVNPTFNIEGFGRLYKNYTQQGNIPEFYFEKSGYQEMYLNDNWDVSFSFICGENHSSEDGLVYVAPTKIVFWYNLEKIESNQRRDDEAHRQVAVILNKYDYAFNINGLETGINNIYQGYNTTQIQLDDLQPFHVFAYTVDLRYELIKTC